MTAKSVLRRSLKVVLKTVPHASVLNQSKNVFQCLFNSFPFDLYNHISCYLSMETEIQTVGIINHLFTMGKNVYVPYLTGAYMKMVPIYPSDLQNLQRDKWGIPVPPNREPVQPHILDLIIVPGLGFDVDCGRIGYGKGYYDRYFNLVWEECRKWETSRPKFVGLCLQEQIVDKVPMETTDWRLDGLIIGDGRIQLKDSSVTIP